MISCWWSSDVYSVSVGRWTDNETGEILKTCYFNKKYFWGAITTVFWSFNKSYIWLWSNSETSKLLLVLVLCFLLLNYTDMKCSTRRQSTLWEIADLSHYENDILLFPKKWCFNKNISNFVVVCDVTNYKNI